MPNTVTTTSDMPTTTTPASSMQQSTPSATWPSQAELDARSGRLPDPTAIRPRQQPGICRTVILQMTTEQARLVEHDNHGETESPAVITHVFDGERDIEEGAVSLKVMANGPQTPWLERVTYGNRPGQWRWPGERDQGPRSRSHAAERMTSDPQRKSQSDLQAEKIAEQERAVPVDPQGNVKPPRLAPVSPNGQVDPRAPAIAAALEPAPEAASPK